MTTNLTMIKFKLYVQTILCSIREVFGADSEEEKNFKNFKISLLLNQGVENHHKFNLWGEKTILRLKALILQLEEACLD